jgi:hypothetical protein
MNELKPTSFREWPVIGSSWLVLLGIEASDRIEKN